MDLRFLRSVSGKLRTSELQYQVHLWNRMIQNISLQLVFILLTGYVETKELS